MLEFVFSWNVKMEHNHMGRPHWGFKALELLDALAVSDSFFLYPSPFRELDLGGNICLCTWLMLYRGVTRVGT
jgi:hypothetical protein